MQSLYSFDAHVYCFPSHFQHLINLTQRHQMPDASPLLCRPVPASASASAPAPTPAVAIKE